MQETAEDQEKEQRKERTREQGKNHLKAFWLRRMSFALCQGRFMEWWVGGEPRKTAGPSLRGAAGRRTLQEGPNVGWGWR